MLRKLSKSRGFKSDLLIAWNDFIRSFSYWRIFYLIGTNEIKKRYQRSSLGQLWLTLTLAVNIAALGVVWSYLWKMPIAEFLPYIAVGTVFWTYISSSISEGAGLYITSGNYLRELQLPKLSYVNSLFVKNLIIIAHNFLVLVPILLFIGKIPSLQSLLLSLAGFILTSICLFPVVTVIAVFSLRFRDLPNIILSLLQIIYYVTPIMWQTKMLSDSSELLRYIVLNPFCVFLSICRDPLCGMEIPPEYWLAAFAYTILSFLIAIPFFSKFRARIVYWL